MNVIKLFYKPKITISSKILVYLFLIITIILWGSAFVGIKVTLKDFNPIHLSIYRFIIASAAFGIFAGFKRIQIPQKEDIPGFFFLGIVGITVYNLALNYGEQTISAGAASFIINIVPIFTTIMAMIYLGEQIQIKVYLGILLSFIGIGCIGFAESETLQLNIGIWILLLAAIAQSIFFIYQKTLLRRYTPLTLICYSIWLGTLCMLPLGFGIWEALSKACLQAHLAVIYLGVFPAALGYLTWTYVLSSMQASKASSFLYLVPLVSIILEVLLIQNYPKPLMIFGGLIAILGVFIGNLPKVSSKTNHTKSPPE